MRLTNRDLKLSLSATEEEQPKTERYNPLGDTYGQISRFPGRVVSIETAYGRIRKNPDLSIEDACLTPKKYNRSTKVKQIYSREKLIEQTPAGYVDDLRSNQSNAKIARTWELDHNSVKRHRILLNEEQQS